MSLVTPLSVFGWSPFFDSAFQPHAAAGLLPARVALEHKHAYALLSAHGELTAACTGAFFHDAHERADFPAVGDWVAISLRPAETHAGPDQRRHADIHAVLPRRTKFSRRAVGSPNYVAVATQFGMAQGEQIVAANVDTVFLVTALDANFNLRRIERYLLAVRESRAQPVVVLSKADLHPAPSAALREVMAIARGTTVVLTNACASHDASDPSLPNCVTIATQFGKMEETLAPWLTPGHTVAFIGSSGVGKSTLINRLLGADRQLTSAVSAVHGKGRHTTTHRELILAPSGVLVLDTPGMRELQLWDVSTDALAATFDDIATLAARCRFHDCAHATEPGCAVRAALEDGALDEARWASFQKLQREQAHAARRADPRLARETKSAWKKINREQRALHRLKNPD